MFDDYDELKATKEAIQRFMEKIKKYEYRIAFGSYETDVFYKEEYIQKCKEWCEDNCIDEWDIEDVAGIYLCMFKTKEDLVHFSLVWK